MQAIVGAMEVEVIAILVVVSVVGIFVALVAMVMADEIKRSCY